MRKERIITDQILRMFRSCLQEDEKSRAYLLIRCSPTICAICLPAHFTGSKKILPNQRIFWTFEHQYHADLYDFHRRGTPPQNGKYAADFAKKRSVLRSNVPRSHHLRFVVSLEFSLHTSLGSGSEAVRRVQKRVQESRSMIIALPLTGFFLWKFHIFSIILDFFR